MTRVVLALILVLHAAAHADNPSLVKARRAVEDVRYDDARRLLVEALTRGGAGPDELREIYRLSAATALVLGEADLAEQYYRRMLALDPGATLPADASPKLREPFVAAQAYMAAQGRLDAHVVRKGTAIEVTVTDPLGMAFAVTAIANGTALPELAYSGQPIVIDSSDADEVAILDEHGNSLRVIGGIPHPAIVAETPPAPAPARTPIVRRWVTWAIPAGVFAGVGVGFLIDAQRSKGRLDDILANDSMHFFDEAEQARERWQDHTLYSNLSFAVAGAFTVTAIVMAATRPTARTTVTASITADNAGIALHGKFW